MPENGYAMLSPSQIDNKRRHIMDQQNNEQSSLRLPAWMLALSLLPFIAVVASGLIGFIGNLPVGMRFDKITPPIMAAIQTPWILINLFIGVAVLNGTLAGIIIAYATREKQARPWMIGAIIVNSLALTIAIINMLLRMSVINFNEATLGDSSIFKFASTLGYIGNPLIFLATLLLCVGLAVSGMLRKTGMVIGAISSLLFILAYVPAVSDSMPPFIIAFLWMPIGIALLLKERHATSTRKIALPIS
jgi:hypothetical protein